MASKYEGLIVLKPTKARKPHNCARCGTAIEKGEIYLRETIEQVAKPPSLILKAFCVGCGKGSKQSIEHH